MIIKSILLKVSLVIVGMLSGTACGLVMAAFCYVTRIGFNSAQYEFMVLCFSIFGLVAGVFSAMTYRCPRPLK
jgi:hypothetical protein